MTNFDDILKELGTGKWNLLYVIATAYWVLLVPYHSMGAAFLTPQLKHTCATPGEDLSNYTRYHSSQCEYNFTTPEGRTEQVTCTSWDFDNTTYVNTITSEFKLVCENSFLRATFKSVYFVGACVGSLLCGWISDRYGRKTMLTAGILTYTILGNSLCWLQSISAILAVRFFMGMGHPSSIEPIYTLVMETCEPCRRSVVGILVFLPWCFSIISLGGLGYLLRDWRWLMFTVSLPALLILPLLLLLSESPRWLIVRGRHEEALQVLRRASHWNNVKLPSDDDLFAIMEDIQKEVKQEENRNDASLGLVAVLNKFVREFTVLVRTKRIRLITLSLYLNYLVLDTVYYGLSLGGDRFGVDPFVYMAIGGLMEIPANTITIPLVAKVGRRVASILCFFVTAGSLLALGVTPSGIGWLVTTMVMVGKLSITAAYMIVYFYANELFPTEVRQRGMGTAATIARLGSVAAPFVVDLLGAIGSWVPLVTFGGAALVAALVTFRLPETRGMAMNDTVAELEAHGFRKQQRVTFLYPIEEENEEDAD